jgi:hypothetical protein
VIVEREDDRVTIRMSRREAADALEDLDRMAATPGYNRAMLIEGLRKHLVGALGSDRRPVTP